MNRPRILLAIVIAYTALFRAVELNRPFAYDAEGSGCLNGVLARSYLRFGWNQSHGMPVLSLDPAHATPIVFYPDHPPLVPLLIVPFYAAFGVGEWQTRLPMSLLTIAAIVVLFRMLRRVAGDRVAVIASALFAATPMVLYFGGFADVVGIPLVCFVLLTVDQYMKFHEAPDRRAFGRFVAAFALAGVCDWPAYVLVPVLTIHFAATRSRKDDRWMVAFVAAAVVLFLGVYAYITLATHSPWTWIVPLFRRRSAIVGGESHSWADWMAAAINTNRTYHSLPLLLAAAAGAAIGMRGRRSTVARLLLAWAAAYAVIGSKALYDHEWAWMPFTPGLAVGAAIAIDGALGAATRAGMERSAHVAAVVSIAAFATATWISTRSSLRPSNSDPPYDPREMGRAIQAAAPDRGDVALLVGGDDAEAQLWFYGDRAVRTSVHSIDDFHQRQHAGTVDLLYRFNVQPWRAPATGIVFPRSAAGEHSSLRDFLRHRYPVVNLPAALDRNFEVFDLRHATAGPIE